jgi:hypothetical protein
MKTAKQIRADLKRFGIASKVHQHSKGLGFTNQVQYLVNVAECGCLLDFIAEKQPQFRRYLIQFWKVDVVEDIAIVTLLDSNGTRIFWRCLPAQAFPLCEGIELRVCCDLLYIPRKHRGWTEMVGLNSGHKHQIAA